MTFVCKNTCTKYKVTKKGSKYPKGLKYCSVCEYYTNIVTQTRCPCCKSRYRLHSVYSDERLQVMIRMNKNYMLRERGLIA